MRWRNLVQLSCAYGGICLLSVGCATHRNLWNSETTAGPVPQVSQVTSSSENALLSSDGAQPRQVSLPKPGKYMQATMASWSRPSATASGIGSSCFT